MSTKELKARAQELETSEGPMSGDEVDLISARLRESGEDILADSLRDVGRERRAWSPWTWQGEGREVADALGDLQTRRPGTVRIQTQEGPEDVRIEALLDFDHTMDQELG